MSSVDEISTSGVESPLPQFFAVEEMEWNGRRVANLTGKSENAKDLERVSLNSLENREHSTRIQGGRIILARGRDRDNEGSARGETGITFEWGGREGVTVSGYVEGGVTDRHGNHMDVHAEQRSDGTKSVDISVGHDRDRDRDSSRSDRR